VGECEFSRVGECWVLIIVLVLGNFSSKGCLEAGKIGGRLGPV
jgi:hypothetical protein